MKEIFFKRSQKTSIHKHKLNLFFSYFEEHLNLMHYLSENLFWNSVSPDTCSVLKPIHNNKKF